MNHNSPDLHSVLHFVADPIQLHLTDCHSQPLESTQVPTPPSSHHGSPVVDDPLQETTLVSVSTTFYPGAPHHSLPPDVVFLSSDNVFFYAHSHILFNASDNAFNSLLPSPFPSKDDHEPIIITVSETSAVLNIILHLMYDISCVHYSPPFPLLVNAVDRLPVYGVNPKIRIVPSSPLYSLLLSHAPLFPLELYALASAHDLYDLAVATSSHLLSFQLATLTDEMAARIGPVYLKRLFFLHFGRSDALKRVLLPPPHPHPPTPWCDFTEQKKLTRAWALASAYLAWDARPDLSTSTMESALRPLTEHLTCENCQQALQDRIKNLIVQWSVVKRTI
ncbi:hypothetical protein AMATHDRAFT_75003 [Amanita thiersii Skay4041]|uniref:BTB domain-containing protein n=1 Tax=Amanita thiersii Skay4041 TaxID=703135 RepID=A0A2A9NQ72_9AGAR|nr:hypothetical protein AMATHDRAFT_75003 [Amanita thiersii Skay4041]